MMVTNASSGANVHAIALTEMTSLTASEAFRKNMDYFSHSTHAGTLLACLARESPTTRVCMHGKRLAGKRRGPADCAWRQTCGTIRLIASNTPE